jgi:hypothetical protein
MYRNYIPAENGLCTRFGRTYKSLTTCLKHAKALSMTWPWVEVHDDSKCVRTRLLALVRQGTISGLAA